MYTIAQRVEAPFAGIIGTEDFMEQPARILLRETYRLSVYKLHGNHSVLGYVVATDHNGNLVRKGDSAPCFTICIDGRKAGVAQDFGDNGWFFQATNEDGASVNDELPQAVGAMVRSYVAGTTPDAEALRVFDAWTLVAESNAQARTKALFGDLRSGVPNTTDPERRGFQPN
jgi:hypothetical protein